MTIYRLFAAYPEIIHAISWVELFVCQPADDGETAWDMMMNARTALTLDEVVQFIKEASADEDSVGAKEAAVAEMDYPQFRIYIAGKMGMA